MSFQTGITLAKASFAVVRVNRFLFLFPAINAITTLILFMLALIPLLHLEAFAWERGGSLTGKMYLEFFLILIIFFYAANFITLLFNVGLIACVLSRLQQKPATLAMGFHCMKKRWLTLMLWTLVVTLLGSLIRILESWVEKWFTFNKVNQYLAGLTWFFACFFVLPVLAAENVNQFQAVTRSAHLMKNTWGTSLAPRFGIGLFIFFVRVMSLIPLIAGFMIATKMTAIIGSSITMILFLATTILNSTTQVISVSALYLYAIDHKNTDTFYDGELLKHAFHREVRS
ncbi:MAG TPA: DUF6159 family protein [Coxiellaceae bacterium]|nr:DUF6159 family protein [Coxiellaceae bacterium]